MGTRRVIVLETPAESNYISQGISLGNYHKKLRFGEIIDPDIYRLDNYDKITDLIHALSNDNIYSQLEGEF